MNTVFIEVQIPDGEVVTLNPAMIIAIEPYTEDPAHKCYVRTAAVTSAADPETGAVRTFSIIYVVQETREALQARIHDAQRRAREDWWAMSRQALKSPATPPEGDDPSGRLV